MSRPSSLEGVARPLARTRTPNIQRDKDSRRFLVRSLRAGREQEKNHCCPEAPVHFRSPPTDTPSYPATKKGRTRAPFYAAPIKARLPKNAWQKEVLERATLLVAE
jgi:hypothetical protein